MKTNKVVPARFEFHFPRLDTQLLVEVEDGEVTIRATRDTFSPRRKAAFVRELAAEGFIPDEFYWLSQEEAPAYRRGVRWVVDFSWLEVDPAVVARSRRCMLRLIGFAVVLMVMMVGLAAEGRVGNGGAGPLTVHSRNLH